MTLRERNGELTSIRVKLLLAAGLSLALVGTLLHAAAAQDDGPGWAKPALCLACHKVLTKDIVLRFDETKHAQAEPAEGMAPADIARRSLGFNPADNSYVAAGIGCQTCHGPGSVHVKSKPDQKKATKVGLDKLKTPDLKLSVCGQCHGQYTVGGKPFAAGFKAGDDLFAVEGLQLAEAPQPGLFSRLNEFMASKHKDHDVTCITCHTSHEETAAEPLLRKKLPELCLDCHQTERQCQVSPAQYPDGATCATCHMDERRHSFAAKK